MPWATRSEACFSEIPLGLLDRLVERRSRYGFGFRQDVLLAAGGARVWYIDNDTPVAQAFRRLRQRDIVPWDGESPLWELTPFVDFPGEYGGTMYRFEWEREWRVPGRFTFTRENVAFLLAPEAEHTALRRALAGYTCPYFDPLWRLDRIQQAVAALPTGPQAIQSSTA
jgi:hypothetical protein